MMDKIMISTTIPRPIFERIKRDKLKYNDLIESAIHYIDMDIRDAKELRERLEKLANLVQRLNIKIWELEGKMMEANKNVMGNTERQKD